MNTPTPATTTDERLSIYYTTLDQAARFPIGGRLAEIDRTAELVLSLSKAGKTAEAIWLIFDSQRFDAPSFKFLAERVQARESAATL